RKNLFLALRESLGGRRQTRLRVGSNSAQKHLLVEPDFSGHDMTDPLCQHRGGTMFHEYPSDARPDQLLRVRLLDSRRHHQDVARKPYLLTIAHTFSVLLQRQIDIVLLDFDPTLAQNRKSFVDGSTMRDLKAEFVVEKPRDALAKDSVVVQNEDGDSRWRG